MLIQYIAVVAYWLKTERKAVCLSVRRTLKTLLYSNIFRVLLSLSGLSMMQETQNNFKTKFQYRVVHIRAINTKGK